MNKLIILLLFSITTNAYALPECPKDLSKLWDKCFGTLTYADGEKDAGYYLNGEYIPYTCEAMGLVKGSSEFGQCVITLINKL